jgi:predicted metal-dependent hydrolase
MAAPADPATAPMISEAEWIETAAGRATLRRSDRRTLAISVLPDGSVDLVAPQTATLEAILGKVVKRLRWIETQRRGFARMNAVRPALRYVNGASHCYLGRQYRLRISPHEKSSVTLRGGYFEILSPHTDEKAIAAALSHWYRQQAATQFARRLASWHDWCRHRRLPEPKLRIRTMPKRWGSAQPDGTICLNPELIRAPSACVDYVITHEICHLRHPDHGPRFRTLLHQLCADWHNLKQRLESGW